ncbi:MAG: response regulator [Verrucomicrobia bacterium]|nr:response regulator [Verrucomicrobiota bacterium]
MKFLQSIRAQFSLLMKRWLSPAYVVSWIVLTFCIVLCVALWGLFRISNLQDLQGLEGDQMDDAVHLAMEVEIDFHMQMENWKNLLLRGSDPEMFDLYVKQFERFDASIQADLTELLSMGHFLEYPMDNLRLLNQAHRQIGVQYRAALKNFNPQDPLSYIQVDQEVFKLSRQPADQITLLVDSMHLHARTIKAASEKNMKAVAKKITYFSLISVVFGISLSAFLIIDRSKKEKALLQAKIIAENANRSKDSFLANISHEIRTPMNAIVGLSEVLSDTELTEEQLEYASTIRQSGNDLLGIINEILDLSKMEAGKIEITPASFQLRDCAEDAADVVAPKAANKGLDFSIQLDPELPTYVTTDEMRLRQIMINLLGNAVKFTDHGRIDFKLEGCYDEAGDYTLSIHVSDTGGGIREDDQPKLFEAFSQVDDSSSKNFGGTGLGLTISRDLCRLMGGGISVNSIYGEGTTFTATIKPEAVSQETLSSGEFDLSVIEGKSIAIVDSSDFNRREMVKFLKRWGANVGSWGSANGFLEHLERGSLWNLVILGSNIKDIPCDRFAAQLRKACDNQIGSILKWAPYEGLRINENPPGFDGVVHKPIQSKPLIRTVTSVLGNQTSTLEDRSVAGDMKSKMGLLRPMNILVVDDNRVNLRVAELILKNHGYEPKLAENGMKALEMFEEHRPDVIFMDMQMPVMDGLEATRKIRQLVGSTERPWIIALTANAMTGHQEMCMEAGMNDFLPKPVKSEAIQQIIQNVPLDISRPPFKVKVKGKLSLRP